MFRVSRKIIYAIEAVADIAYYSGVKPVQNIEIAKRQGIPKRYLEQTLQTLVRSKILVGSRGPKGGYRLAKERRKIMISDIIKSFDQESENHIKNKLMVSEISEKIINPLILEVYSSCFDKLKGTSIEDICKKARESKIKKNSAGNVDFVI